MAGDLQPLSLLLLNARSIHPKLPELSLLVAETKADFVFVTETWLSDSVPSSAVPLFGYFLLRHDRSRRQGGGVACYVRDGLNCLRRQDLEMCDTEDLWIELKPGPATSGRKMFIGVYYRPPDSSADDLSAAIEATVMRMDMRTSEVLILGDFNTTSPAWLSPDSLSAAGAVLQPLFLQLGLTQHVSSSTHLRHDGQPGSLLDLVLSSPGELVSSCKVLPPLGSSDHNVIHCSLSRSRLRSLPAQRLKRLWCIDHADQHEVIRLLDSADWSSVQSAPTVDSAWSAWLSVFHSIVKETIPSKVISRIKPKLPWLSPELIKLIKQKRAAFRAYKRCPSDSLRSGFNAIRNKVTSSLRKAEKRYHQTLHRSMRHTNSPSSSRSFWQSMKRLTGKGKGSVIPDLVTSASSNTLISDDGQKADLLNGFFSSQTDLPGRDAEPPPVPSPACGSQCPDSEVLLDHLFTTPADVFTVLSHLKPGKAPGLDDLSTDLLRFCAAGISTSLATLFNRSFAEATVPSSWKEALVVPIFKSGDKHQPTNYRPISLLSVVGKVQERLVFIKLYQHVDPLLSDHQSGFRRRDGCEVQLTRLAQSWAQATDASNYVGALFFDLRKAFDKVWHKGLLAKLSAFGVSGNALEWFRSYLSGRRQRTAVGRALSSSDNLYAGVPQGAILSPLLFIIYTNDIPRGPSFDVNQFADDTSVYVISKSTAQLQLRLHQAIRSVVAWFDDWLLSINPEKTVLMVIRSKGMKAVQLAPEQIHNCPIKQVAIHKHLGLIFNETLSWSDHCSYIVSKMSKRIGLLCRLRRILTPLIMRDLYRTCIRPVLLPGVEWMLLNLLDWRECSIVSPG